MNRSIGPAARVTGAKSIIFEEDDAKIVSIYAKLGYPIAHYVATPACLRFEDTSAKRLTYRGYHELAYLHPNRFTPNPQIRDVLGDSDGRGFLVYHPSWGCLAEEYGLEQIAIERDGKEPSSRSLAGLIEAAKNKGIRVVFVQPQHSERAAETVAAAIGGRVVTVDPLARDWPANLRTVAAAFRSSFDDR